MVFSGHRQFQCSGFRQHRTGRTIINIITSIVPFISKCFGKVYAIYDIGENRCDRISCLHRIRQTDCRCYRQILQKIDPIACAGNHSILYGSIADISLFCCLRKRSASFYRCCKETFAPCRRYLNVTLIGDRTGYHRF